MAAVNSYGKEETKTPEAGVAFPITGRAWKGRGQLYPPGKAYAAALHEGTNMQAVNEGLATETERLQHYTRQAERAIDPREGYAYLEEWEEALGLPEDADASLDPAQRRLAAYEKLTSPGGISPDFMEEVAAALGYEIEVEHNRISDASVCGNQTSSAMCGRNYCTNGSTLGHFCTIHVKGAGNDPQLEAAIRRYFHSHAVLTFVYDL